MNAQETEGAFATEIAVKKLQQPQKFDWSLLNRDHNDIVQGVLKQWRELVASDANENHFQTFLSEHAGLFFGPLGTELVISQLEFGTEYRADLVVARDFRSAGLHYEFIELESPSDEPFNQKGSPSQALNDALQQVRNWQMWMNENPHFVQDLLPTTDSWSKTCSYTIIIGTRKNSREFLQERNQISQQGPITVRSFDSLTDTLAQQEFRHSCSPHWIHADDLTLNRLANPFFRAYSGASWRALLKKLRRSSSEKLAGSHFLTCYAEAIVSARKYNRLLDEFMKRAMP